MNRNQTKRITFDLDIITHNHIKKVAIDLDITMRDWLLEAIQDKMEKDISVGFSYGEQ